MEICPPVCECVVIRPSEAAGVAGQQGEGGHHHGDRDASQGDYAHTQDTQPALHPSPLCVCMCVGVAHDGASQLFGCAHCGRE